MTPDYAIFLFSLSAAIDFTLLVGLGTLAWYEFRRIASHKAKTHASISLNNETLFWQVDLDTAHTALFMMLGVFCLIVGRLLRTICALPWWWALSAGVEDRSAHVELAAWSSTAAVSLSFGSTALIALGIAGSIRHLFDDWRPWVVLFLALPIVVSVTRHLGMTL